MGLIKLVKGNSGSIRITIPKEIVKELNLQNDTHVWAETDKTRRIIISPIQVMGPNGATKKQ